MIFGAGLVDANESGDLLQIDIAKGKAAELFASIERRIRSLHPALSGVNFTHRWGGPILIAENWRPVFAHHPRSSNAIVLGAYAGHGVALSTYLGAWAAEVLLEKRKLPPWGSLEILGSVCAAINDPTRLAHCKRTRNSSANFSTRFSGTIQSAALRKALP